MNSLGEFTALTGRELTDFTAGKLEILMLRTLAWCTAVDGEIAEGHSLDLDEKEFGRLMDMQAIIAFSKILTEQSMTAAQKKSEPPNRSPMIFFRRKA